MLFRKSKIEQDMSSLMDEQSKGLSSAAYNLKEKDWSKHTKPCQDVLHGIAPINTAGTIYILL